jgi:hypothetical protein
VIALDRFGDGGAPNEQYAAHPSRAGGDFLERF